MSPGEEVEITVEAVDPDGDNVNYYYEATGGRIRGTGSTVIYEAPDREGTLSIEIWVSDGEFDSSIWTIDITVQDDVVPDDTDDDQEVRNSPPVIEDILHQGNEVKAGGELKIKIIASDLDGDALTFAYSAEEGQIIGEGSEIVWRAPDDPGLYSIEVMVSDGELSSDPETISIRVVIDEDVIPTDDSANPSVFLLLILIICFLAVARRRVEIIR
jgi:hypothetical protein